MSGPTLKVLRAFAEAPGRSLSGMDLTSRARVAVGTVYPLLARLEKAGWLSSAWEEADPRMTGRPRRRLYAITEKGLEESTRGFEEHVAAAATR